MKLSTLRLLHYDRKNVKLEGKKKKAFFRPLSSIQSSRLHAFRSFKRFSLERDEELYSHKKALRQRSKFSSLAMTDYSIYDLVILLLQIFTIYVLLKAQALIRDVFQSYHSSGYGTISDPSWYVMQVQFYS